MVTCYANLTANKIRRVCGDCCMRRYRVDPTWGIPQGTPPLCVDSTTGLVRPAGSYTTSETADAEFIGFSTEWFPPGEDHLVWVYTCGWVEMRLLTSGTVNVGDGFKLYDDGRNGVSEWVVQPCDAPDCSDSIFWAVENCYCEVAWTKREPCPTDPPAADDDGGTAAPTDGMTQNTVIMQWGQCCKQTAYPSGGPLN